MLPSTNFQPSPGLQELPGETPEKVDLYADLFAALFTVPAPVKLFDPVVPKAVGNDGFGNGDAVFATEIAAFELPSALDPGEKPMLEKPVVATLPVHPTRPPEPGQPEFLGPPVSHSDQKKASLVGMIRVDPHERKPLTLGDTCGFPVDGKVPVKPNMDERLVVKQPESGGVKPPHTEYPSKIKDDRQTDTYGDLLEIPRQPAAIQATGVDYVDSVELPAVQTPVDVVVQESVVSSPMIDQAQMPIEFPIIEQAFPTAERAVNQPEAKPGLLETFTSSVMVDARPREVLKTTLVPSELSEFVELTSETRERKIPETEHATEFSFDSSIDAEPAPVDAAAVDQPDAKLQRAVVEQVGKTVHDLASTIENEKREITIRLKPEELGSVEITLSKNQDGVIEAHFRTETPQTQHLLNESLMQLRESLENSGFKVGSLETSCGTAFAGGHDSGTRESSPPEKINASSRTTFDDPIRTETVKNDRLVNLQA